MGLSSNRLHKARWLLPTLAAAALVIAGCGSATPPEPGATVTPTTSTSATTTGTAAPTSTTGAPTTTTPTTTPTKSPAAPTSKLTSQPTPKPTSAKPAAGAATPAGAIGVWMAKKGFTYAGDCATTTLEDDIGKHCSSLCKDLGDKRIYKIGPTFSEYTTWLLLKKSSGGWLVTATAPDTGTAPPPW